MRLRSFFCIGLGMLAAAFLYLAPVNAFDRGEGIYAVSFEVAPFYKIDIAPLGDRVATSQEDHALEPDRSPAVAAMGPVYALSMKTDGQSLRRYHMRC